MSGRTEKFEDVVYDILRQYGPLRTRDILPLVQKAKPELCDGDREHDVHNAQQVLRDVRKLIVSEPLPDRPGWYRWQVLELERKTG